MGRFKPGQSGNPAGRKPGTKTARTKLVEALADDLPGLLAATKEAALGGDMVAMRLLLERALPVNKQAGALLDLPAMQDATDLTGKATAVLDAIANGEVPPEVGAQLVTAITSAARVAELDALTARLDDMEERLGLADRMRKARERATQRAAE